MSNVIIYQKVTHVSSHHFYYSMCSKCPPSAQMEVVDVDTSCRQHVQ